MFSFKFRGKSYWIVFFFFLLFFILFVVILLFTIIISWERLFGKNIDSSHSSQYKHLRLDPLTNATVGGLVTLLDGLGSGEYVSYVDGKGHINLISNFGDKEYECHGECYCEQEDEEDIGGGRRTAIPIQRGLIMLVAAVSSMLALNIAKERFAQECYDKYRHACTFGVIIPGIPFCKEVFKTQISGKLKQAKDEEPPKGEATLPYYPKIKEWRDIRTYYCEARCVEQYFIDEELEYESYMFGCQRIKVMGEISVDLTKIGHSIFDHDEHQAFLLEQFEKKMVAHCRANSKYDYYIYDENYKVTPATVSLCAALDEDGFNPTVRCNLIDLGKKKGQEIANEEKPPEEEGKEEYSKKDSGGFSPVDLLNLF